VPPRPLAGFGGKGRGKREGNGKKRNGEEGREGEGKERDVKGE